MGDRRGATERRARSDSDLDALVPLSLFRDGGQQCGHSTVRSLDFMRDRETRGATVMHEFDALLMEARTTVSAVSASINFIGKLYLPEIRDRPGLRLAACDAPRVGDRTRASRRRGPRKVSAPKIPRLMCDAPAKWIA